MAEADNKVKFSLKKLIENVDSDRKKALEILDISKTVATAATTDEYSKILLGQSKVLENLTKSNQQLLELILSEMKKKNTVIDPTDFTADELNEAINETVEMD